MAISKMAFKDAVSQYRNELTETPVVRPGEES
jgi:hypothetical protein